MSDETRTEPTPPRRRAKLRWPRLETVLAIFVGILLGLALTAAFVFTGSEDSIDAPRLHSAGVQRGAATTQVEATKAP